MDLSSILIPFCIVAFAAFLTASHLIFYTIGRDAGYKAAMKEVEERNGGIWTD